MTALSTIAAPSIADWDDDIPINVDGEVLVGTCAGCGRDADPDTECLIVVLGRPLCSACAKQKAGA